ncbi:solute carrier family 23 protein, partial [Streptomyces brasiliscabiei]|uniref:solute carrier family 23 protein n=1 Tax=Streptomyces brasiliscabiei TaxID=2736302 RepID=UPI0030150D8C
STTLLFSGLGTILFLLLTGNRLPSYLGSSFAFIAPILALGPGGGAPLETGEQISQALLGVFVTGVLLAGVGFLVQATGTGWI